MRHATTTQARRFMHRVTGSKRRGFAGLALAGFAAGIPMVVTVHSGDTLSGIAAQHGTTYQAIAQANHIPNPNLIYAGQRFTIPNGSSSVAYSPVATPSYSPPPVHHHSTSASSSGGSGGGGGLSDVPGVPQAFAACVALRESSNGSNQAFNGGVYGIINASGEHVNGQSISAQKAAFSRLYSQYGKSPWTPSDGC